MNKTCTLLCMILGIITQAYSSTNIPGGNVSGIWTLAGSPYIVQGTITIPVSSVLTIEPGVVVNFTGQYKLVVNGQLLAIGALGQQIIFTATFQWHGIHILNSNTNGQDSTRLVYCALSNGYASGGGIDPNGGALLLSNSHDVLVRHCVFSYNTAVGNGGAIYLDNSSIRVEKTLIHHNTAENGGGISITDSSPQLYQVTFTQNTATNLGGATYKSSSAGTATLKNCILWNDTPTEVGAYAVNITYSDVGGGYFGTGNISGNPQFRNISAEDYSLMPCSPCVDAGDPASPPDPDGTQADMGALYFHHYTGSILPGGDISGTLYASLSPYFACSTLTVPQGSDLIIEPGVEIRFASLAMLDVDGRLLAEGTSSDSIVFTSFDTTGFHSGTWPGWSGVRILNSNTNGQDSTLMEYCKFTYIYSGGRPVYLLSSSDVRLEHSLMACSSPNSSAVYLSNSNALIKGCEISHNVGYGVYLTNSSPVINACQFLGNTSYGMYCMSTSLPTVTGCTFDINSSAPIRCYPNAVKGIHDNTYIGTQYTYISVIGGTLSLDSQWENPGIYYRLSSSLAIHGMDGPDNVTTLTLEPGTEMRFPSQDVLTVGHASDPNQPGALVATGTAGQNITFKGTSSSPGYWQGIVFNDYSVDSQCRLEYCTVEYGGYSINCNVSTVNASPQMINSIIRYSSGAGVRDTTTFLGNPSVNLINCQLTNNATNGVYCSHNSQAVINGCTFELNTDFAVHCWAKAPGNFVNNTYNGYHYGGNILVEGDTISLDSYWEAVPLAYYINGSLMIMGTDGPDQVTTLQLAPGTTFYMAQNTVISVATLYSPFSLPGALVAVGTPEKLIRFTALDPPDPWGYWQGIEIGTFSDDSQCRLDYCWIEHGGAGGSSMHAIEIFMASPSISHTVIKFSQHGGISAKYSFSEITHCVFDYNIDFSLEVENSSISFRNNIVRYTSYCIYNGGNVDDCEYLNNCFSNYISLTLNTPPPGLGTLQSNNFNGYPCDGFMNIFCTPQWDNDTSYHLTGSSPCINAGDPGDPFDPDYTISDIGMFYYPIDGLPVLDQVMDVPNDQGKNVHVIWSKSPLDESGSLCEITGYSVWRQDEVGDNTGTIMLGSPGLIVDKIEMTNEEELMTYGYQDGSQVWTFITQLPAVGLEQYAVVAPTLFDSVASSINYATFRVYAHTNYAPMYFPAVPDSGYSVDNLAPHVPENLTAALVINQVHLEWNSVPDEDFQYYAVYRSTDPYVFPDVPFAMTIDTLFADTSPLTGTAYYVVTAFDFNSNESDYSNVAQVTWSPGIILDLKAYMDGPYLNIGMYTTLNISGYLPLSQPYNEPPWNYPGSEAVALIPNPYIVDWVLLELRETPGGPSSATSATVVARKALFVLNNGSLVDLDGSSLPIVNITVTANLYAVVRHRNHLAIMSSAPLLPSGGVYAYDFTNGPEKTYGGALGCKQVAAGVWGMIPADGNASNMVDNIDKNDVWRPQSGTSGYKSGDFNLNAQVDNADKNDKWRPNSGKSSQVPN